MVDGFNAVTSFFGDTVVPIIVSAKDQATAAIVAVVTNPIGTLKAAVENIKQFVTGGEVLFEDPLVDIHLTYQEDLGAPEFPEMVTFNGVVDVEAKLVFGVNIVGVPIKARVGVEATVLFESILSQPGSQEGIQERNGVMERKEAIEGFHGRSCPSPRLLGTKD